MTGALRRAQDSWGNDVEILVCRCLPGGAPAGHFLCIGVDLSYVDWLHKKDISYDITHVNLPLPA